MIGLVLVMVVGTVMGGTFVALMLAYTDIEERRALGKVQLARRKSDRIRAPRFFMVLDRDDLEVCPQSVDDRMVANVEAYLVREQAMARNFVSQPTVDRLYCEADRPEVTN